VFGGRADWIAGSFDLPVVIVCVQSGSPEKRDMIQLKDVSSEFPKFQITPYCPSVNPTLIVHDHQGLSSSRQSMPPARQFEGLDRMPILYTN
jgi:hypothetical protein